MIFLHFFQRINQVFFSGIQDSDSQIPCRLCGNRGSLHGSEHSLVEQNWQRPSNHSREDYCHHAGESHPQNFSEYMLNFTHTRSQTNILFQAVLARTLKFADARKADSNSTGIPKAHWMELKLIQSKVDIESPQVQIKARKVEA